MRDMVYTPRFRSRQLAARSQWSLEFLDLGVTPKISVAFWKFRANHISGEAGRHTLDYYGWNVVAHPSGTPHWSPLLYMTVSYTSTQPSARALGRGVHIL